MALPLALACTLGFTVTLLVYSLLFRLTCRNPSLAPLTEISALGIIIGSLGSLTSVIFVVTSLLLASS